MLMREDTPRYSVCYASRDIEPEELEEFVAQVLRKFENLTLDFVMIDFIRRLRKNVYRGKLAHYRRAHAKWKDDIRKYRLHFCGRYCSTLYVELTVRMRDYRDTASYAKIELDGKRCNRSDFAALAEVARSTLRLEPYPGKEWGFEDSVIKQDCERAICDDQLREQTIASISDGQYDAALRTASSLVEDLLRHKCLAAGRAEAATQTGGDLAVTAFNDRSGCLSPPWPLATQAQLGVQLMFQGFFLYVRNAFVHNAVVTGQERQAIFECLMTCEFLLQLVKRSSVRRQGTDGSSA